MEKYSFTYGEVNKAYEDCVKTKKNTGNAIKFTVSKNEEIVRLCDEINDGSYEIGSSIAFIVKYPVLREVFAADFRDRIVHHLIMNELMSLFEDEFIDNSFACRKGKGVLYGIRTVSEMINKVTDGNTKDAWVFKMDVKSFFMSINKILLSEMVDDLIVKKYPENRKKEKLRWLCRKVIMHHPEKNCRIKGDRGLWDKLPIRKSLFTAKFERGLPIGNLTSQIFANYYMSFLDKYIVNDLGFTYYGRYVDDFLIMSNNKEEILSSIPKIVEFAKNHLLLDIHPDKRYCQYYKHGVRFTGGVIKPGRTYILNRTIESLEYKLSVKFPKYNEKTAGKFMMVVNSYLGYMGNHYSYRIRKKLLTENKYIQQWLPYIWVSENYRKIKLLDNPFKFKPNDYINLPE